MRIPQEIIHQIYQRLDIVEVIGDYVSLKKRGANYWGLSPFKIEKTPSFAVNPIKNIFKDFSTGKGGNAVSFLMEVEKYTYLEAMLHLAKKYNIEVELDKTDETTEREDKRLALFGLNKFASTYFSQQLLESSEVGYNYFKERGFEENIIKQFQLGYSPENWDAFTKNALKYQYKEDLLVESGLIGKTEKGDFYDRFRGRVIFPIHDTVGRIAGFGGRILKTGAEAAKYINSPESIIYNKSELLYGLFFAKNNIREAEECVLVEGYTDVISLHQAGIKNAVASAGTALTPQQLGLIRRYTSNLLIAYDGDEAGIKAAKRAVDLALEQGFIVKILLFPEELDPDSYVKKYGLSGWNELIKEHSLDFILFKIKTLQTNYAPNHPQYKAQLITELAQSLAKITDEIQRSLYTQHSANQLNIDEQLMVSAVNKELSLRQKQKDLELRRTTSNVEGGTVAQDVGEQTEAIILVKEPIQDTFYVEKESIRLIINYYDKKIIMQEIELYVIERFQNELGDEIFTFKYPVFETLRNQLFTSWTTNKTIPINELLTSDNKKLRDNVSEMFCYYEISEHWEKSIENVPIWDRDIEKLVEDTIYRFKKIKIKQLIEENQQLMKENRDNEVERKLLKRSIKLTEMKNEINRRFGTVVEPSK